MAHPWKFFRAGGFDQVKISSGADLANLDQLDQTLWVALACPTRGVEFDTRTLDLIDTDQDGRIRAPELIAAAKWACASLKNPDDLLRRAAALPLASINDATPEGKALLASARQILANLGKTDATDISIADTTDTARIFAQTLFNGDGIIPVDSAGDDATQAVIADVISCFDPVPDRSGKPGIDQVRLDQFFAEATAFSDWNRTAEADAATTLPFGDATAAAYQAFKTVKAKADDYFARCRLAAFDARAVAALNRKEEEYLDLAAKDLSITAAEVSGFPLARIEAARPLPLRDGINPAWAGPMSAFAAALKPRLGDRAALSEADWTAVTATFAAYEAWAAAKAGVAVETLGIERVRDILAGQAKDRIAALIAKDKALEPEANAIAGVDKLVRFHRDLYLLSINFVSFEAFYDLGEPAIFQAGTLYLDQRSCTLTLTVEDAGKHAAMAGLAGSYLAYVDCLRPGTGETLSIVAAFTGGDSDNLMVGRNGLFYDRKGQDWDATITQIVDNPISIRQAFWYPYKKVVRLIEEQVAKRAAAADTGANTRLATTTATTASADKPGPAAKPRGPKTVDVGTVAALAVAFGAIGALITSLLGYATGVFKLPFWQIVLAVAGLVLLISGPSMLIAWLKLSKRNLAPILDANGWAVNAKARMNVPFGAQLTGVAKLPPGSTVAPGDRFGEKPPVWPKLLLYVIVIGFLFSLANDFGVVRWVTDKVSARLPGR